MRPTPCALAGKPKIRRRNQSDPLPAKKNDLGGPIKVDQVSSLLDNVLQMGNTTTKGQDMNTYSIEDRDDDATDAIDAASPQEAAEEYASAFPSRDEAYWITVGVWLADGTQDRDDCETIVIAIQPDEPECSDGTTVHAWDSPSWLPDHGRVGQAVCLDCGCSRITDNNAQNRVDGTQGHTSISYCAGEFAQQIASKNANTDKGER